MAITDLDVLPTDLPAIEEISDWVEHLPAMITGVLVKGGASGAGAANFQARVFDARTRYLKKVLDKLGIPASDDKVYQLVNGTFKEFTRYDLPVLKVNATFTLDPLANQTVYLDNSLSAAKTITLKDGPRNNLKNDRAETVVVTVVGSVGLVSFATQNNTPLGWHGGNAPSLSGSVTNIILYWVVDRWIGQVGAVVP